MSAQEIELLTPDTEIVRVDHGTVSAIVKSEVEAQLDAAHKYPRSIKKFLDDAITLATFTIEIAESCIYALPRDGKTITGPSIRLAEICASAYGNLHVGARVVGAEDKEVVAQGVAWDLEKNLRVTIEKRRRITSKTGKRFNDDMITVTGNAAASIGLRDAIFRTIPRAYVNAVYDRAREVAVGTQKTLGEKRARVLDGLMKMGIPKDRIFARIEKVGVEDIGLAELELLIGLATAIKSGDMKIDDAFPPNIEATKGVIDLDALKPGKEENRGHGKENLTSVPPEAEKIAEERCNADDWHDIETAAGDAKIKMAKVIEHIMATMGCKPAESLPKARKGEVLKWMATQKR